MSEPGREYDELGPTETARILRSVFETSAGSDNRKRRPIEELLQELGSPAGSALYRRALQDPALGGGISAEDSLLRGKSGLHEMRSLKEQAKERFRDASSADQRNEALLGYFVCVAAALQHHRRLICNLSLSEAEGILLDLAEVSPEPWTHLFSRAAVNCAD